MTKKEEATNFVNSEKRDWNSLYKNISNKSFRDSVLSNEKTDERLKRFINTLYSRNKDRSKSTLVKGTSGNYKVKYNKDLGRYTCTCPDWTMKKSVDGSDCKHIRKTMVKVAAALNLTPILNIANNHMALQKQERNKPKIKRLKEMMRQYGY